MTSDAQATAYGAPRAMLDAFGSVGATTFDLTITDRDGEKVRFRRGAPLDDLRGVTVAAASSLEGAKDGAKGSDKDAAQRVGKLVAERAIEQGVKDVVFDRGGYIYHGRVKALADAAREAGLQF